MITRPDPRATLSWLRQRQAARIPTDDLPASMRLDGDGRVIGGTYHLFPDVESEPLDAREDA